MIITSRPLSPCINMQGELTWWHGLKLRANLDNKISAKPSVQMAHNTINANGCLVTLLFHPTPNPQVRQDIAGMLLTAFEKRRRIKS